MNESVRMERRCERCSKLITMIGQDEIEKHRSLVPGKFLCDRCLDWAEEPTLDDQVARDMTSEWRRRVRSGEDD
jgi:hypothetical protein